MAVRKHAWAPRLRASTRGLRERAWWVMRRRGVFTLPELLATLASGAERDAQSNLGKYVRALARAGILRAEAHRAPGAALTSNGYLRYRLTVDNGRKAPVWRAVKGEVFDPNTGAAYPLRAREEAGDE